MRSMLLVAFLVGCAHVEKIDDVKNPVVGVSPQEACKLLTARLEQSTQVLADALVAQNPQYKPRVEIVTVKCYQQQLRAVIHLSAVVDDNFKQAGFIVTLFLLPDGSIVGEATEPQEL